MPISDAELPPPDAGLIEPHEAIVRLEYADGYPRLPACLTDVAAPGVPRLDYVLLDHLVVRAEVARDAGVREVWIDPGIGFGKTREHNLALLAHLDQLVATGWPVVVGTSRKGFLGRLLAASDGVAEVPADDRLEGSLATATWAMAQGVRMVRAHDVRPDGACREGGGARRRGVVMGMKGKWAQGIQPRNFAWVMKGKLAVCERPGGYGANHRRVRRQEEIIWIREQGFTCVVSIIPAPHNLHNYTELDVTWRHRPFGVHDEAGAVPAATCSPSCASSSPRARRCSSTGRSSVTGSPGSSPATSSGRAWCRTGPKPRRWSSGWCIVRSARPVVSSWAWPSSSSPDTGPTVTDRIELRGLRVAGICGVLPEERERPQPLEVDLDLVADLSEAGRTDDLAATIDYGRVCADVEQVIAELRPQLLERLAEQDRRGGARPRPGAGGDRGRAQAAAAGAAAARHVRRAHHPTPAGRPRDPSLPRSRIQRRRSGPLPPRRR